MDDNIELSDVCRLCLSTQNKSLSIFGNGDLGDDSLLSRIRACVNVEVLQNDGLPSQICQRCSCHINLWYYFKQDCEKTQKKLKSWHGQVARRHENHSDVNEVIHIKQEPQDECDSFRVGDLEELAIDLCPSPQARSIQDGQTSDGVDEEGLESGENSMNLIIMDTTSMSTVNLGCRQDIGSTVIELQPEDEDLLRTVVESEEGLRNSLSDEDEVMILESGLKTVHDDIVELTIGDDSCHSSQMEEVLEDDLDMVPAAVPSYEDSRPAPDCSVMLSRVKQERDGWSTSWSEDVVAKGSCSTSTPEADAARTPSEQAAASTKLAMYQCPCCPRTFSSNRRKNIHRAKSHKGEEGTAAVTAPSTGSPQVTASAPRITLPKIVNACFDEEKMTCKVCNKAYPNSLWHHMRRVHADLKPFACAVCRRIFATKRELTAHRLRALSKYCRLGKAPQTDPSKMYILNPKVPKNTPGRYTCKECPQQFRSFTTLKKHFTLHSGDLPYQCCKCKREYRDYKSASIHFKNCFAPMPVLKLEADLVAPPKVAVGEQQVDHKCAKCLKNFSSPSSLSKHKKLECNKRHYCVSCSQIIDAADWEPHIASCSSLSDPKKKAKAGTPVERYPSLTAQEILNIHKNDGRKYQGLQCKFCQLSFSTTKTLRVHILKHSGNSQPLKCEICNLTVQLESTLKSHMESYHGGVVSDKATVPSVKTKSTFVAKPKARINPYAVTKLKCDQCHKLFSSMSALQFHKRTHLRNKPNPATKTSGTLPDSPAIKPASSNHTYVMCHLCKKLFHSRKALWQHKKIHSTLHIKMKIYKCTLCGNSYSDAKALQLHKASDHGEKELAAAAAAAAASALNAAAAVHSAPESDTTPYKCETCGKFFSSDASLAKHRKLHEVPIDRKSKYKCLLCQKSFLSALSLMAHKGWHSREGAVGTAVSPHHGKVKAVKAVKAVKPANSSKTSKTIKYPCPVCGNIFLHRANTKRHMLQHHPTEMDRPIPGMVITSSKVQVPSEWKCKQCSEIFSDVKLYNKHLRQHQNPTSEEKSSDKSPNNALFVCKLCKKTFKSRKGYKRHVMGHSIQKPFKCDICANQYSSESALEKHKFAHEFKPFACNKCKACFLEKEELINHYERCNVKT